MSRRGRTDRFSTLWMLLALVAMGLGLLARGVLPQPWWTLVHVVTLGVLTNGILQWSWYFTRALLHLPPSRANHRRVLVFNLVLVLLVAGMWTAQVWVTVAGATGVGAVAAWHGAALTRAARGALGSRFAVVVRFYRVAAGFLVLGCALAGVVTVSMFAAGAPAWLVDGRDRLTLAHALVNAVGWIGLSVAGTLVTLGPTMLRTRMLPGAVDAALRGLPVAATGVLAAAGSALGGWMPGVGVGLLAVAVALGTGVAWPLARTAVGAGPREYPSWTLTAGLSWVLVGALVVAGQALVAPDAMALRTAALPWIVLLGAGGMGQVFVGALAYLMPVVIGGGPFARRAGMAVLATAGAARVTVRNSALLLLLCSPSGPRPIWWALVLLCYVVDVVLFALAGVRQSRARRAEPVGLPIARTSGGTP